MSTIAMNKKAEDQLLGAVREVSASVEGGASPTDAIIKVAQSHDLGVGMVPLLVQAYNVGRTTWQQEHGGPTILEKQATFPIARVEAVMAGLYPIEVDTPANIKAASAISDVYKQPPAMSRPDDAQMLEKAAHYTLPTINVPDRGPGDPMLKMAKAYSQASREKRSVEEARHQRGVARDQYLASLGRISDYFKQAAYWRKSFAEVEYNATLMFGEPAKHAVAYAYCQNDLTEKRATGPPSMLSHACADEEPYSFIADAIEKAAALLAADQQHRKAEKEAEARIAEIVSPFVAAPNPGQSIPSSVLGDLDPSLNLTEKSAGLFGNLASMGVGAAVRGGTQRAPDVNQKVQAAELELNAPEHLRELREIETRAMLNDLLTNDEVISGYDPAEVLDAYNEIAQLSPLSAGQPAVIRPLLRKRLAQGAVEPFEAQQMVDIEKTLGQTSAVGGMNQPAQPEVPSKPGVLDGSSILS